MKGFPFVNVVSIVPVFLNSIILPIVKSLWQLVGFGSAIVLLAVWISAQTVGLDAGQFQSISACS